MVTNSLVTGSGHDIVPSFGSSTDAVVITNKEYVRDLYCPQTLNAFQIVDALSLNPGLGETFPWLSQVAMNYEEFEFQQLAVTFKSIIDQSLATNGQSGQVALTTSYNPGQDPFGSKQEMMGYAGGMSCKTNQSMIHGVECDPAKNSGTAGKYVRPGYVANQDLKNYDLGTTYISILDAPTQFLGQTLGELWVSYTVVLRKPKLAVAENYNVGRIVACAEGCPPSFPFGASGDNLLQVSTKSTIPVTFVRPGAGTNYVAQSTVPNPAPTTAGFVDALSQPFVPLAFNGPANITQLLKVVFPPWYSGIVEIYIRCSMKQTAASVDFMLPFSTGQVFRYCDLPLNGQSPYIPAVQTISGLAWTHIDTLCSIVQGTQLTGPQIQTNSCRLHLRILPANNGVENAVIFGNIGMASYSSWNSMIEVVGLNTYLSLDDAPNVTSKNKMPLEVADQPGVPATYP